ncbi:lysine--tRNA ligase [Kitasatospora sp. NPDC057542]|uniref:lysine--tRNA ligase n=1 Tax=Streptomycetaceae TaxID=2062 RepID=UPI001CC9A8C0|nr:lysine--tRNA ligase [Streptomyces sp. LS1784]
MALGNSEADWVSRFADEVIAESERRAPGRAVVVASGLSPSGPVHLGNLREVMTPHLVADEIRRRGVACEHLLSWDDYDRFRKVPAGIDPAWAEHIGKPLTSVPAPPGSSYPNWAEHFKAPMVEALDRLGVEYRAVSQTEQYRSGAYRKQILLAMRERGRIYAVLDGFRTKDRSASAAGERRPGAAGPVCGEGEQEAAAGSGAAAEEDGTTAAGYFPYKPYCSVCERDLTTVTGYDDATTTLDYGCACGHRETVRLAEHDRGKLVWKVDWPMRWAYEGVVFEPSGVDHQSPGSSFVVGGSLVQEIFGGRQPIGPMYAFVGISGMAKMSSSKGGVPTAADALRIMEEPLLRWLYARRKPQQSFTVAFDQEIQRLYDEWDALERKVQDGTAGVADRFAHDRAVRTAGRELPRTGRPLPYRMLASVADITAGDPAQTLRILGEADPECPVASLDELRPRLDRAQYWIEHHVPEEQRTRLRTEPDRDLLAGLDAAERESLKLLLDGLDEHWSLEALSHWVYAVPKLRAGLPADAKATPELKVVQRAFFALVYRLLVGGGTGPRLPTLLLATGADRVRTLLGG